MLLDKHLDLIIQNYGTWTCAILFLIIFCETGLAVPPSFQETHSYLPGELLLRWVH